MMAQKFLFLNVELKKIKNKPQTPLSQYAVDTSNVNYLNLTVYICLFSVACLFAEIHIS